MDAPVTLPNEVQIELNVSILLSEWFQENLATTMTLDDEVNRQRLALVFFNIALETREAVLLLVAHNARSPALALGRPMLDAVVRGLWFQDAASSKDIDSFLNGRLDPKFDGMLKGLKGSIADETRASLRTQFDIFSDFTHGSHRQAVRWLMTSDHSPGHTDRDMVQLLHAVDRFGIAAAVRRQAMSGANVEAFGAQMELVRNRVALHAASRKARSSMGDPCDQ